MATAGDGAGVLALQQLERMGRELKCPICLSLFKEAAFLSCNHCFCKSCILTSIKGASVCPICKVPTTRREVKPSPLTDSIVSIYRGMESAAGITLFATQSPPDEEKANLAQKRKRKAKAVTCDSGSRRFPAKKRIQAPQVDVGEDSEKASERRHRKLSDGVNEPDPISLNDFEDFETDLAKNKTGQLKPCGAAQPEASAPNFTGSSSSGKQDLKPNETLPPFFWLSSQQVTEGDEPQLSPAEPVVQPAFSDLKSSENHVQDHNMEEVTNGPDAVNSDAFFWTQCSSSPELQCNTHNELINLIVEDSQDPYLPIANFLKTVRHDNLQQNHRSDTDAGKRQPFEARNETSGSKNFTGDLRTKRPVVSTTDIRQANVRSDHAAVQTVRPKSLSVVNKRKHLTEDQPLAPAEHPVEVENSNAGKKDYGLQPIVPEKNKHTEAQSSQPRATGAHYEHSSCHHGEPNSATGSQSDHSYDFVKEPKSSTKDQVLNENAKIAEDQAQITTSTAPTCAFCQRSGDCKISGEMTFYKDGVLVPNSDCENSNAIAVHKLCAEWAPDVYFTEDENEVCNLEAEISRSQKLKCSSCCIKGAALGCCLTRCRKTFHYPCAKALPNCKWHLEKFIIHCPDHANCAFPGTKKKKGSPTLREALREEEAPGVQGEQKWSVSRKWILCGSGLNASEKELLTKFASVAGVTVESSWNPNVTHIIAGVDSTGAARRTMKFMTGVLEGKWILKSDWLSACLIAGHPVDEAPYEISSDMHGILEGPKRGRSLVASQRPKLFEGFSFYFVTQFEETMKVHMQYLVQAGGGTVLHRKPIPLSPEIPSPPQTSRTVIIYQDESEQHNQQREEASSIAKAAGAVAQGTAWLLDSVAGCKLRPLSS